MQAAEFSTFAQALCNATAPVPDGLRVSGNAVLAERFAVYRNNVHSSLIDTLVEQYSITRALVGEEFFRAMAREFVLGNKPATAVMHEYGSSFPAFVASFPPAAELPFLGDVAQLELAWRTAWAAAEAPCLNIAALATLDAAALAHATIKAHPAAQLRRSKWPIASLWQAHQQPEPDLSTVQWHAEAVLITRPLAEVLVHQLMPGAAEFVDALMRGQSIEYAAATAMATKPQFDTGAALGQLLGYGVITELVLS